MSTVNSVNTCPYCTGLHGQRARMAAPSSTRAPPEVKFAKVFAEEAGRGPKVDAVFRAAGAPARAAQRARALCWALLWGKTTGNTINAIRGKLLGLRGVPSPFELLVVCVLRSSSIGADAGARHPQGARLRGLRAVSSGAAGRPRVPAPSRCAAFSSCRAAVVLHVVRPACRLLRRRRRHRRVVAAGRGAAARAHRAAADDAGAAARRRGARMIFGAFRAVNRVHLIVVATISVRSTSSPEVVGVQRAATPSSARGPMSSIEVGAREPADGRPGAPLLNRRRRRARVSVGLRDLYDAYVAHYGRPSGKMSSHAADRSPSSTRAPDVVRVTRRQPVCPRPPRRPRARAPIAARARCGSCRGRAICACYGAWFGCRAAADSRHQRDVRSGHATASARGAMSTPVRERRTSATLWSRGSLPNQPASTARTSTAAPNEKSSSSAKIEGGVEARGQRCPSWNEPAAAAALSFSAGGREVSGIAREAPVHVVLIAHEVRGVAREPHQTQRSIQSAPSWRTQSDLSQAHMSSCPSSARS